MQTKNIINKKFDRRYLFLEYNLTNFLFFSQQSSKKFYSIKNFQNSHLNTYKKTVNNFINLSQFLTLVESSIQKDFISINHFWTFLKIYSKPQFFKFFPDRRSFFCYWIFPFLGFITISGVNGNINNNLQREIKIFPWPNKAETVIGSSEFESLVPGKGNQEPYNYAQASTSISTSIREGIQVFGLFNNTNYSSTQTISLSELNFISYKNKYSQKDIKKLEIEKNRILTELCQNYLKKTSNLIYDNSCNFLTENGNQRTKFSDTILTDNVYSRSSLSTYWYILNSKKIIHTLTLKKQTDSPLFYKLGPKPENRSISSQLLSGETLNLAEEKKSIVLKLQPTNFLNSFPKKLIPFNCLDRLSFTELKGSKNPLNFNKKLIKKYFYSVSNYTNEKNLIRLRSLLDVEIKEKDFVPFFVTKKAHASPSYKVKESNVLSGFEFSMLSKAKSEAFMWLKDEPFNDAQMSPTFRHAKHTEPLMDYKKGTKLFNNIEEQLYIDYGIRLQKKKLKYLFLKELNMNSNFLNNLKKLLISSKFFSSVQTSSYGGKKQLSNNLLKNYEITNKCSSLNNFVIQTTELQSISRKINQVNNSYLKTTKDYLNLIFRKKLCTEISIENVSNRQAKSFVWSVINPVHGLFEFKKIKSNIFKLKNYKLFISSSQLSAIAPSSKQNLLYSKLILNNNNGTAYNETKNFSNSILNARYHIKKTVLLSQLNSKFNKKLNYLFNKHLKTKLNTYNLLFSPNSLDKKYSLFELLNFGLNNACFEPILKKAEPIYVSAFKFKNLSTKTLAFVDNKPNFLSLSNSGTSGLSRVSTSPLGVKNESPPDRAQIFELSSNQENFFDSNSITKLNGGSFSYLFNKVKTKLKNKNIFTFQNLKNIKKFHSIKLASSYFLNVPTKNYPHINAKKYSIWDKNKIDNLKAPLRLKDSCFVPPTGSYFALSGEGKAKFEPWRNQSHSSPSLAKLESLRSEMKNGLFSEKLKLQKTGNYHNSYQNLINSRYYINKKSSQSFNKLSLNLYEKRTNPEAYNLLKQEREPKRQNGQSDVTYKPMSNVGSHFVFPSPEKAFERSSNSGVLLHQGEIHSSLQVAKHELQNHEPSGETNESLLIQFIEYYKQMQHILHNRYFFIFSKKEFESHILSLHNLNSIYLKNSINNILNRLKLILDQSQFYVTKIGSKKNLHFKKFISTNFYLTVKQPKKISLTTTSKSKYFIKNKIQNKFVKNHLILFNKKPAIEKIFRNYLSSKYTNKLKVFNKLTRTTSLNKNFYNNLTNRLKEKHIASKYNLLKTSNLFQSNILTFPILPVQNDFLPGADRPTPGFNNNKPRFNLSSSIKTPYNYIKKVGFIFFNKSFYFSKNTGFLKSVSTKTMLQNKIKNSQNISEIKYFSKNFQKQTLFKRLEKAKNLQKKRRRKKQARENKYRKKRKRFYPRPIWLRFLFYQKFMKFRHKVHSSPRKELCLNLNRVQTPEFHSGSNFAFPSPERAKYEPGGGYHASSYEGKIQIFERSSNTEKQINFRKNEFKNKKSFTQNKFLSEKVYKIEMNGQNIRTNIYRTNKQNWGTIFVDIPNLEKITVNKQLLVQSLPIFSQIKLYDVSNSLFNDFRKVIWKSYWLRANFNSYINRIENYLNSIKISLSEYNVFNTLKKFLLEIVGLNLNQNRLKSFAFSNYLDSDNISVFQFTENSINEKFLSSINKYKISSPLWYVNVRRNFTNISEVPNGYTYLASSNLIHFNHILYNRIQFIIRNIKTNLNVDGSSESRIFNPGRMKPFNVLDENFWASILKDWWIRIENFLNVSFSVVNIPQEIYLNQAKFRILWSLNKTNLWSFQGNTATNLTWNKSKMRDKNKSNKTKKLINTILNNLKNKSLNNFSRQNLIDKIFVKKLTSTNEKIKQLGFLITDRNIHSFSYLNLNRVQIPEFHSGSNSNSQNLISSANNRTLNKKVDNLMLRENLNSYFQNHPKNYLQFWWIKENSNPYNLIQTDFYFKTEFEVLPNLSGKNEFGFRPSPTDGVQIFELCSNNINLWGCFLLFHLCILVSLVNISEIRTFIKFQILFIYKVTNIYLTIIYSIFLQLKRLKTDLFLSSQISNLVLKNWYTPKKSFLLFSLITNKKSTVNYMNPFVSQKAKLTSLIPEGLQIFDLKSSSFEKTEPLLSSEKLSKEIHTLSPLGVKNGFLGDVKNESKLFLAEEEQNLFFDIAKKKYFVFNQFEKFILKNFKSNHTNISNNFKLKKFIDLNQNLNNYKILLQIQKFKYMDSLLVKNVSSFLPTRQDSKALIFNQSTNAKDLLLLKNQLLTMNLLFRKNRKNSELFIYNSTKMALGLTELKILMHLLNVQNFRKSKSSFVFIGKYIQSYFYLFIFSGSTLLLKFSNQLLMSIYNILLKFIDILEGIMFLIYKFFEKPAELMVDFISEFFLIEWSSDVVSFLPESLDIYAWSTYQKLTRNFRLFGLTGFFWQRRFFSVFEIFSDRITKPDIDLIIRQRKGIIFWDIWAEILVQAAEVYNINLSSLINIKEEQDLFLQTLLTDRKWDWSNSILSKMSPLMELINTSKPNGLSNSWLLFKKSEQVWRRWTVNPYYTYQGKETDLFVEIHPPKSFSHFKLMKYYGPIFEPVGNLVCQIYSGTFIKGVSKNLLLVGSRGTNKTLLIEALAGETELKIMIDNANRYAFTSRGVAIGLKLLKDVFEALVLQAPCLFIIEDIHLIGERRPMLISDDENIKGAENSFGVEQEEVHEKNQVIYQLSRHSIVHYKKPYKGDFSLLIPTNHFCLDFFLGFSPPKTRVISQSPQNPLPIKFIEKELSNQNFSEKTLNNFSAQKLKLSSQLQLPKKEIFAPPATSPFTILLLKEQKKLKPRKIVSQLPWGGLSSDQLIQLPKSSYSIRVKVALLADIAIRNLSVKLDRITDLLIIIDSVRSNRGFAVVGTTHLPSILDPALRRPGRFDETLTIPVLPNLWSRWEILKSSISNFSSTLDLLDLAQMCENLNDTELLMLISRTKLFLLTKKIFTDEYINRNNYIFNFSEAFKSSAYPIILDPLQMNLKRTNRLSLPSFGMKNESYEIEVPSQVEGLNPNKRRKEFKQLFKKTELQKLVRKNSLVNINVRFKDSPTSQNYILKKMGKNFALTQKTKFHSLNQILNAGNSSLSMFKTSTNCLALSYSQISKWLISSQLIKDNRSYSPILWSAFSPNTITHIETNSFSSIQPENNNPFDVYNSQQNLKNQLLKLLASKTGEFFVFYDIKYMLEQQTTIESDVKKETFWNSLQSINTWQYSSSINLYGIDQIWRRASHLIFSIIYKKCLYNKNILIYRLFNLQSFKSLRQIPSPPASSILLGSKRYENYKRVESEFQNRISFLIHEKIQKHQQQRFIKTLYNKPIKQYFSSQLKNENSVSRMLSTEAPISPSLADVQFSTARKTNSNENPFFTVFETSFRELSLLDLSTNFESKNKSSRISSISVLFNNRVQIRHRFYLINQWWNTQLPEHNSETTFLSEIDWRYMFAEGIGDLWMDFPDADQHYNPRNRQWMLNSGYWSYWSNFEKYITQEIYYQFVIESFYKAYNFLDSSRELLDLTSYKFLTSSILKEIDLLIYLKRFYVK